ncbi:MAG: ORF6N domain-containing protein [Bacilli bacterium]|nr:ORF6N domain-containing protein [Bacilli bacterium]
MKELLVKDDVIVENMIYEIRGQQVMLDSDLAKLYQCKNGTKTINLAVKRHINRFPERFMFRLTREEYYEILRSQSETLELKQGEYSKYLPYVFTEQGVAMLATIIKTEVAEVVSIRIMDAFVYMRRYFKSNNFSNRLTNLEIKTLDHDNKIDKLFDALETKKQINEIYFKGQIFDAYSKIVDIFKTCKNELIIIDSYADKIVLDMIKNLNIKVILIVKENANLKTIDIDKYNEQYNNLKIVYSNDFHDRYFIIDRNIIYHCGASINHAGSKTFSINILEDNIIKNSLLKEILLLIY